MTSDPKLTILDGPDEVADHVAGIFADAVVANPSVVLGLATGGSPVATYGRLIDRHRTAGLDFSRVTTFNLDEYIGLGPDHPQSFRHFMQQQLFDHVNVNLAKTHVPDGCCRDLDAHVAAYEAAITGAGGIELQLLGIGSNGHIAFNEPGSPADSRTRKVALTQETIDANSRFFDSIDDVPRTAITMGIGTILESRRIVLIATGTSKAEAVAAAIRGPRTIDCPASLLQSHDDVTLVIDQAAAAQL
ncbi:Glucosamine-6-phosphate deaminase 1 [Rubripirellula lacrimiformis]|uniref:Glucosamine-6-phosphate deaminase n=1 Tax=Rubripirellula lacrimiformis TaxID=1930273 RepID=A0A517NL40_9BACT|nr:glucosamine-6-phosphate deaminase [Rubripirellula lacrimiformis]QDT07857.1 Glucosamine-6-phosphate deaminase 1 [Rubripirellula lacrimiformis]